MIFLFSAAFFCKNNSFSAEDREHPEKEWWRERRVCPDTFMGFPDVVRRQKEGGELYVEHMNSMTIVVTLDRMLKENILNEQFWEKFCWRTQHIVETTVEPDLLHIFRSFCQRNSRVLINKS